MSIEYLSEQLGIVPSRGEAIDNLTRIIEALYARLVELEEKVAEKEGE